MFHRTLPLTHRPERDGSVTDVRHVPATLAIEFASTAWARALYECSEGALSAMDVMVVNISADFSRELLTGTADASVVVTRIGNSSLTLDVLIDQDGERCARVGHTLVRVKSGVSHPLTEAEKALLRVLEQGVERATGIEPA
ncbi:hotdog domain-containing protein [Actinomycetes bacterium M1A6_2h]